MAFAYPWREVTFGRADHLADTFVTMLFKGSVSSKNMNFLAIDSLPRFMFPLPSPGSCCAWHLAFLVLTHLILTTTL